MCDDQIKIFHNKKHLSLHSLHQKDENGLGSNPVVVKRKSQSRLWPENES